MNVLDDGATARAVAVAFVLAATLSLGVVVGPAAGGASADGQESTTTDGSAGNDSETVTVAVGTSVDQHGSGDSPLRTWAIAILVSFGALTLVVLLRD